MFVRIENDPRDYAWGSRTAIAELLGHAPSGAPEAELWLGAHPGSPSRIVGADASAPADLAAWVAEAPEEALGAGETRLPFLLKVLAADAPLSLQAHPSLDQAARGFARENEAGLAPDAADRNYKDAWHKPELILALSDTFDALCGFRALADTRLIVDALAESLAASESGSTVETLAAPAADSAHESGSTREASATPGVRPVDAVAELQRRLEGADETVLRDTVAWLLGDDVVALTRAVVAGARGVVRLGSDGELGLVAETTLALAEAYPDDPGIVVSLLLNRVRLDRGQALYLPAGNIHAYLAGLGVELMASSDNVLRGGLTAKHVDVDELLAVLDFRPLPVPFLRPTRVGPGVERFSPDVPDFALYRVRPDAGAAAPARVPLAGPAIALAVAGSFHVRGDASSTPLPLERGQALYVTPEEGALRIEGEGDLFLATVND